MTEYAVHVTTTADLDHDDEELWDQLMDALAPLHASIGAAGPGDARFSAQLTVEAPSLHDAARAAADAVVAALADAGVVLGDGGVAAVEVATPAEFERRLVEPRPEDLLTTAEVAELLGVSRQRVHALAETDHRFPRPATTAGRGLHWPRLGVERFAMLRRGPGRPTSSAAGPADDMEGATG